MDFRILQKFQNKIAEQELQQLDGFLTYFRVLCLWKIGEYLAGDSKIDSYIKIAAKREAERIFYRRLIINTFRVLSIIVLLVFLYAFLNESSRAVAVSFITYTIVCLYLFVLLSYASSLIIARKYRLDYSIPFLISCIVVVFAEIYYLGDFENKLKVKVSEGSEKAKNILAMIEEGRKRSLLDKKKKKAQKKLLERVEGRRVLTSKRFILRCLELAAKYIEYYIPRKLKSGDVATDDLFKHSMQQVAAALRDKKMWLLTPMEDTYDQLIVGLIDTLTKIVNDDWHDLERRELVKASRPTLSYIILRGSLKVLQTIFMGSLVLLLFLLFELISPFPIDETVRAVWLAGGFLWLGITILIRLDPDVATKFSLLKDAKSLLSSQDINPKQ